MKKCPYCAEEIQVEAIKCKHRGSDLTRLAPATPSDSQDETSYHSDVLIQITNARAVLRGTTYAMANITSVSTTSTPPERRLAYALILLGILLMTLWAFSPSVRLFGLVSMVVGVVMAARAKPKYVVRLGSASGEMDAFESEDRQYVEGIVAAMNRAIVERG